MFTGVMWRLVVWCAKWEAEVRPGEIRTRGEDPRRGRSIGEGEGWGRRVTKKNIIKICSRDRKARAHANIAVCGKRGIVIHSGFKTHTHPLTSSYSLPSCPKYGLKSVEAGPFSVLPRKSETAKFSTSNPLPAPLKPLP